MKFLRKFLRVPLPPIATAVKVDPEEARADLSKAASAAVEAQVQAAVANRVVASLDRSLVRNGFAPAIERNYARRHLGGAN